ncbi:MAG TPA: hypothetical protein VJP02_26360 [Candidatus Sulfotelmatobacter sp.]|nr:hypothetical protein [Candidatus Sulfotelmatobacter sp.]
MNYSAIFASLLLSGALSAQSGAPASTSTQKSPVAQPSLTAAKPASTAKGSSFHPDRFAGRAGSYYRLIWGIDGLSVKSAEAGEVIRFTYEVLDPEKAKVLNDKKIEPSLIDEKAHVKLVIPQMDKVGKLRQTAAPEAGRKYWMLFSNKGGHVKRGDRVNIVIGTFHADGLVVD